jgi:hypothetical protein
MAGFIESNNTMTRKTKIPTPLPTTSPTTNWASDLQQQICRRAYDELEDWLQAEPEVTQYEPMTVAG